MIITDNSLAMILACLHEFNNETLHQYLERTFRIIQGKASKEDLMLTLLHICYSHTMKYNKVMVDKLTKKRVGRPRPEVTNFLMRYFARLVECRRLEELTDLVEAGLIVMTSKFATIEVQTVLKTIEKSINEFPHVAVMIDDLQKEAETISSNAADTNDVEMAGTNEGDVHFESDQKSGSTTRSSLGQYWNDRLSAIKANIRAAIPPRVTPVINKLYHPAYFEYLESKKLPTVTLWTNVCIGDLSRFNTDYHVRTPHLHKAKNFHIQNKTSGQVEGLFSVMKRNPECHKLPLDHFVRRQWDSHKGLQRQFTDGLWEGIAAKESGTITASSAKNICLKQLSTDEEEDFGLKQRNQPIEESWNKQSQRARAVDRSGVYRPGKRYVSFSSMPGTPSASSLNDIEKK